MSEDLTRATYGEVPGVEAVQFPHFVPESRFAHWRGVGVALLPPMGPKCGLPSPAFG